MPITSTDKIRTWLKNAKESGATHLVVACDNFDYEDYPVFVQKVPYSEEIPEASGSSVGYQLVKKVHSVKEFVDRQFTQKNMQSVMEVYSLSMDWDQQLASPRVFNYE